MTASAGSHIVAVDGTPRELLYTAVTRAKSHIRLIGTETSVRAAIARRVVRASGLVRLFGIGAELDA